ncbi:hypothetical protein C5167_012986 [Papaver somniferum]|uniref:Uncharacterized protein n=1 Tax=Papaver somniferum TaxID=3469 RepID=A0A4Y7IZZ7_PAPSO|nr:hypothetical protein C5167_012986 [Papaver somniferum]
MMLFWASKVMRSNLDALNVDVHEFFIQLYNLMLEYRPDRIQGEVLAEALKTTLFEGRHDMQRAPAFIKRLAAFSNISHMHQTQIKVRKDITENEKLTKDLALTVSSIRSYEEYKWQKKKNRKLLDPQY